MQQSKDTGAPITGAYRYYVLFVLTVVYTVNFIDRQILSILLQPIKEDLGVSDTMLGYLSGTAFALFYATLGYPIAILADRWRRVNIIAVSLAIFSFMTALSGLAQNFWQLALARVGVGIGEAGTSPPSHSMISDIFPIKERSTALAILGLGVNAGVLFGFLIGGWVNEFLNWRAAFFVVGLPGLLIALLVSLTVREPIRGAADAHKKAASSASETHSIREVMSFLWSQKSFRHLSLGFAFTSFAGYSSLTWAASFLARSFDMGTGEAGTYLALVVGIGGGLCTFLCGFMADRLSKHTVRWNMWLLVILFVIYLPFALAAYSASTKSLALILFAIPLMITLTPTGPCFAMTQAVVKVKMRAQAAAILFFIINLIGLGMGPAFVGTLSDQLADRAGDESLRWALFTMSFITLVAAHQFYLASRTLKDDIDRANEDSPAAS